jgi:fructose-1,6-bisphosphatase
MTEENREILEQLKAEVAACKQLRKSAEVLLLKAKQFSQQNFK